MKNNKKDFEQFMKDLKLSINNYDYFVDFKKVYKNCESGREEINLLNKLIGSKNIEKDFAELLSDNQNIISFIPSLLALRDKTVNILDGTIINYTFSNPLMDIDNYCYFMRKTGLFDLLEQSKITNLYDYLLGLEVGMDTNARKNRGGKQMEKLVESFLKAANLPYKSQINKKQIDKIYNLKLDDFIDKNKFKANKIFDFAFEKNDSLYLIETNFYGAGGSKLNETARSFKSLAKDLDPLDKINFIWITDGQGWHVAANNLREAYESMDHLYSIDDLENGLFEKFI